MDDRATQQISQQIAREQVVSAPRATWAEALRSGWYTDPVSSGWVQGLKTGLAAAVSYWLSKVFGFEQGYWAAVSAIVVMQSEVGPTVSASRDRLVGTAVGALIGWGTVLIWHQHIVIFGLGVALALVLCNLLGLKTAGRLGGVTVAITVLIHYPGPAWRMVLNRFFEVSFGIVVALAITLMWEIRLRRPARID